ncbi:MAG: hypothetical protein ACREI7_12720, partial [Myxococcota bacterium]
MPLRRLLLLLALATVAPLTPAVSAPSQGLPDLDRVDPVRHALGDAIVERAMVEARDGITMLA